MCFKNFFFALPLVAAVACSESEEMASFSYGEYELSCVESATKKNMADTLFLPAVANVTDFDITVRRQVLADGVFSGEYEYLPASSIQVNITSDLFWVDFKAGATNKVSNLSLSAPENVDYLNPVLSSLSFSIPEGVLSMPIKQEKAQLTIGDDYFVMHPDYDKKEIYLDNKGAVVDFRCALASSYYINGVKNPDFWCDENCSFSYELEKNDWIKIVDCLSDDGTAGLYNLRIESVRDDENGEHLAMLTLRFELDGKIFEKQVRLVSTEVYHVG